MPIVLRLPGQGLKAFGLRLTVISLHAEELPTAAPAWRDKPILYDTGNLIHRYQPGQHVAAALSLFASVALLFWYVLHILMSLRRN